MKTADEKVWHASPTCRSTTSTYNHYRKLSLLSPKLHIPIKIFHFPLHFSRFSQAEDLVFIPSDGRFSWLTHLDFNFLGFFHIWSMLRELLLGLMLHVCAALGVTEGQVKDLTLTEEKEETHTLHLSPRLRQLFVVVLVLVVLFFLLAKLLC